MPIEWLSEEKCKKMLPMQTYGRLATVDPEGTPYITPVNYVYLNEAIYFHTGFEGRKIRNIKHKADVCFEISAPGNLYIAEKACGFTMRFWCILISGKAEFTNDVEEKRLALKALMDKYARRFEYSDPTDEDISRVNIIKITIESMSGKLSIDPQKE